MCSGKSCPLEKGSVNGAAPARPQPPGSTWSAVCCELSAKLLPLSGPRLEARAAS